MDKPFQPRIIGALQRCQYTCDEVKRLVARPRRRETNRPDAMGLIQVAKKHLAEAESLLEQAIVEDKP